MRYGYARISKGDKQSLDLQTAALEGAGIHPVHIFCDVVTGATMKRNVLLDVTRQLKKGDVLVVWKLDRLARDLSMILQFVDELRALGVDLVSLTEPFDTTTPTGNLLFQVVAMFAAFEREQIRERTRAGLKAARANGKRLGRPPTVTPEKLRRVQKELEINPNVRRAARLFGLSPSTVRGALKRKNHV